MVSVITPVHDRPQFLEEAIISIQNQTFSDWEHIVIDDGSTNNKTQEILAKVAKLPNVIIYRTANKGLGAARNFGIEKATGEFILTLDDDDKWRSDFIEKALDIFKNDNKVGAVTSNMQLFGYQKNIIEPEGGEVGNFLVNNNSVHGIFKKADWLTVGKYDESYFFQPYTDWDFWLRLTYSGKKINVIKETCFYYRTYKKSSMLKDSEEKHVELFKFLIEKNKNIYAEYFVEALVKLESKLVVAHKNSGVKNSLLRVINKVNPLK